MSHLLCLKLHPFTRVTVLVVVALASVACGGDGRRLPEPGTNGATPRPTTVTPVTADIFAGASDTEFALRSPSVSFGEMLPARHARDGGNVPPELRWTNVPPGTEELAVIMTDLSADGFVHWVMTGIDPMGGNTIYEALVPPGAVQARNDFGELGWGGPAPPAGDEAHTYAIRLLALGQTSGIQDGERGADLIPDLEGKAIGMAELVVFYRQAVAVDP